MHLLKLTILQMQKHDRRAQVNDSMLTNNNYGGCVYTIYCVIRMHINTESRKNT